MFQVEKQAGEYIFVNFALWWLFDHRCRIGSRYYGFPSLILEFLVDLYHFFEPDLQLFLLVKLSLDISFEPCFQIFILCLHPVNIHD